MIWKNINAIIPCGIKDKGVTNLKEINNQNYEVFRRTNLIKNFISNLKILSLLVFSNFLK